MPFSRRSFIHRVTTGAAASALLQFPLTENLFAQARRTGVPEGAIRLNSNENPYGPLPSAMKAMQDALTNSGNRYPFTLYNPLAERIAAYNKVDPKQIVIGAGSTEPMRLAAQAFCSKGKNIILADPTFESMGEFATEAGAEVRKVPLTKTYAHDLDGMLQRTDANTALVYICNPNNPTASLTPAGDLETFIGKLPSTAVLVLDEAYHHFAMDVPEYRPFLDRASDRVIVMRTFSKIYGMAGMRLGYSVASAATTEKMKAYLLPISVNSVAAAGGLASLDDDAAMKFAAQRNAADRGEFFKQAVSRKLHVIPSAANFAMVGTNGKPAGEIISAMRQKKVIIGRPFPPMLDYVRISFGLPEEMKAFWSAWDQI
jgi:histidinol-phosphate aminotransferase